MGCWGVFSLLSPPCAFASCRSSCSPPSPTPPTRRSGSQGTGLIDDPAAWRELQKPDEDPIAFRAEVRKKEFGGTGAGIFEREGWAVGDRRTRLLRLDGPRRRTLAVTLTGNDGTLAAPPRVTLPGALPVTVAPKTPGAHSALIEPRDPATGRIVARSLATVVAAIPLPYRATLSVARPDTADLFFRVLPGAGAFRVDVRVPYDGLVVYVPSPSRVYTPRDSRTEKGRWHGDWPQPEPGVWEVVLRNAPDLRAHDPRSATLPPTPVAVSIDAPRG